MYISLAGVIIERELKNRKIDILYSSGNKEGFHGLRLYCGAVSVLPEYLYFVPEKESVAENVAVETGCFVITKNHKCREYLLEKAGGLLVLDAEESVGLHMLEEIFSFYENWEKDMIFSILNNKPLPELLDCCVKLLKNPISVTDPVFRVLAISENDIEEDSEWSYIKEHGYHSEKFVKGYLNNRDFSRCMQNPLVFPVITIPKPVTDRDAVSAPIVVNKKLMGFISLIVCNDSFSIEELRVFLPEVARLLSYLFVKGDSVVTPNILTDSTVKAFLMRENDGFSGIKIIKEKLDYQGGDFVYLVLFWADQVQKTSLMHLSFVIDELLRKGFFKNCYTINFGDSVVVICDETRNGIERRKMPVLLEEFLSYNQVKAAVSLPTQAIVRLPYLYDQISCLMRHSNMGDLMGRSFLYEQYFSFYIADHMNDIQEIKSALHPLFRKLEKWDERGEYLRTLELFILNGMDVSKTAKGMHLHKNSVYYRIKKIEEACEINLQDELERNYLAFSIGLWMKYKKLAITGKSE